MNLGDDKFGEDKTFDDEFGEDKTSDEFGR